MIFSSVILPRCILRMFVCLFECALFKSCFLTRTRQNISEGFIV